MGGSYRIWRIVEDKILFISVSGLVEKVDEDVGKEGICWFEEWFVDDFFFSRLLTVKYKVIILGCNFCR